MEDLKTLTVIVDAIPVAQSLYLPQDILSRVVSHRQYILACNDVDLVKDYINRSTDEECLAVLADISNHAPLSDDYQRVFCHLTRTVFSAASLEIPTPARPTAGDGGELTVQLDGVLENLRRGIRKAQRCTLRGASLQ